jgi:putative ABC transport system permease protein
MQSLLQDLRYTVRMLAKSPGFTAVAVMTLALGIGANTAIFSVLDAVFLKSLPYRDADSLVLLWGASPSQGTSRDQLSFTDTADYRAQNHVFEELANFGGWSAVMSGAGDADMVRVLLVSDGYFKIMKAQPLLGRTFTAEEQIDGKDNEVILSYGTWRNRFGGDPGVVGRTITLNGKLHMIVGVMPASLAPLPARLVDEQPTEMYRPIGENYSEKSRSARHLRAIARLKPGASVAQAQAEMSGIAARLEKQHPESDTDYTVKVVPLKEDLVGYLRPAMAVLFAAVGCVLLIACANVANLLLARATAREKEIAVRAALGADRRRLVRQFLTESLLLSVAGGGVGLLLAIWGTAILAFAGAKAIPFLSSVHVDRGVLVFTFGVSLLTGILFGLFPALRASRPSLIETIKEGGRTSSLASTRSGFRNALVISELAIAVVLLAAAGLLIESLYHLRSVNPGFNPAHVLTMNMSLSENRYGKPAEQIAFFGKLIRQARALPGIRSVAIFHPLPISGDFDTTGVAIEEHPVARGSEPSADRYIVTPGFLDAMQIALLRGRGFTEQDTLETTPVVIVNEAMAAKFWPKEYALGKRIRISWEPGWKDLDPDKTPLRTVVGIMADIKQFGLDTADEPQLYVPFAQYPVSWANLVVRTEKNPAAAGPEMRDLVRSLDPSETVWGVATYDELLSDSVALRRFTMLLVGVFAAVAFVLASIGVYGVMAYMVARRTHEMGVRIALGAQPSQMLGLVVGQGLRMGLAGAAIGVVAGLAVMRFLASLLFGVSASDPLSFAGVAVLLLVVVVIACYVPARRATRVDPMVALRYE